MRSTMKIPETLKIGGHIYKVEYPYHFKERYDRIGHSNHSLQFIGISDDDGNGNERSMESIELTLMHEILHCVDWVYNGEELIDKNSEAMVSRLAEGLYQVLKDNNLLRE